MITGSQCIGNDRLQLHAQRVRVRARGRVYVTRLQLWIPTVSEIIETGAAVEFTDWLDADVRQIISREPKAEKLRWVRCKDLWS